MQITSGPGHPFFFGIALAASGCRDGQDKIPEKTKQAGSFFIYPGLFFQSSLRRQNRNRSRHISFYFRIFVRNFMS